jgi:hypothetical protein
MTFDIPIMRSGFQLYTHNQVFGSGDNRVIRVYKDPKDIKKAVEYASKKKPYVTLNHDGEKIGTVNNIRYDSRRKIAIANITILNDMKKEDIKVSSAYTSVTVIRDNKIYSTDIKIYEVAIVENPRCGSICSL